MKSDFVSGVSHEMRTPLTTVKTLARVLKRGAVSDSEREEFLDLSRIESGMFSLALSPVAWSRTP